MRCFFLLAVLTIPGLTQEQGAYEQMMLFSNILNHVQSNYVVEKKTSDLILSSIRGLMTELDPFTTYLSPERFNRMNSINRGDEFGVGIELEIIDHQPTVISVIQGSAAAKTRIRRGDILLAVEDSTVEGLKDQELKLRLFDQTDSKVKLRFRKGFSNEEFTVTIKRTRYQATTLGNYFVADSGVGYLKLRYFGLESAKEVENALESLLKQGMKKLVFDLRGNPGGSVASAIGIADLFIPKDSLLLQTSGRKDEMNRRVHSTDRKKVKLPVVLLIDRGSASASELVAGVLQDYDRAVLVGTNSFGKAYIQGTFLLSNGGALMMTVGKYKLPSGRTIQRNYQSKKASDLFKEIYRSDSNWSHVDPIFRTSHGRRVHENVGLIPDNFVESDDSLMTFIEQLEETSVLSRYAARFCASRASLIAGIKNPEEFTVRWSASEADVDTFVTFLKLEGYGNLPTAINPNKIYRELLRLTVYDFLFRQSSIKAYLNSLDIQYREALKSFNLAEQFSRKFW